MRHQDWAGQSSSNNRSDLEEHLERLRAEGQLPAIEGSPENLDEKPSLPIEEQSEETSKNHVAQPNAAPARALEKSGLEGLKGSKARPEGNLFYTAGQVLYGWREYHSGSCERVVMPQPDPSAIVNGRAPAKTVDDGFSTVYARWNHVETFFMRNVRWVMSKPFLLLEDLRPGCGLECRLAFESWYEEHPLVQSYFPRSQMPDSDAAREMPELEWRPLQDAIDMYNETLKRSQKKVTYNTALKALKEDIARDIFPKLVGIRPEGKWHTTVAEVRRWQASDGRKNVEESCDQAA